MHWIDWSIILLFLVCLTALAFYTKQYSNSVAGFLVANRCAGRYLLCISQGSAGVGAITIIAYFEMYYKAGFTAYWWIMMMWPVGLFLALSGWVLYRYRESRVMTMAQLFEIRYSRNFRVFCGVLAWITGVLNMGIFPAVTARFFMYFCGLPKTFSLLGLECSTFATIMIIELSIALLITFLGGMIVVMVTDFFQGIFSNVAFLLVMAVLLLSFNWDQILAAVATAPADASLINPFRTTKAEGFNLAYFMILAFTTVYCHRAWQGTQGYNAAATTAHEAKMANMIGFWRGLILQLLIMLIPICAFTILHNNDFAGKAQIINEMANSIESEQIRDQMLVPLALTQMLPTGMLGLFAAMMLAAAIGTDDTYLHSWGSIFIQDVVLPFRKKSFTSKQQMWLLRLSIAFVAVFIFFFSLLFQQNDFILMYMYMTGALYLGGAGAVVVGALYWKNGSTLGAWSAMITGSVLAFGGLILSQIWTDILPLLEQWFPQWQFLSSHPEKFPYDGMRISFFAMVCAITAYIAGSLFSWLILKKPSFNMEQMLHRGKYAISSDHADGTMPATGFKSLLPGKEFSGFDKFLHIALTCWFLGWFFFLVTVSICYFFGKISDQWWAGFWHFNVWLIFSLGTVTTIWLFCGGIYDVRKLFKKLKDTVTNTMDDGRVVDHHSLSDEVSVTDADIN